ncbi:MAG: N-acetyltransferase family protein [Polyangiales bacterium]
MSSELIVRDFEARDIAPACALTNHFIVHTTVHFGETPASEEDFAAAWERRDRRFPWVAADIDGRFAGYCKAGRWRERDAYARTVETGIYVAPEARRTGVASALYGVLLGRLKLGGFRVVVAGITMPNEPSVRLHEALGFRHVGTFHAVGYKFAAWHDVGFWELDLGD